MKSDAEIAALARAWRRAVHAQPPGLWGGTVKSPAAEAWDALVAALDEEAERDSA